MRNDLTNYAILDIDELNMSSIKIKVRQVLPLLYFVLGGHKLTFRCIKRTPNIMVIGKTPKNFKCGTLGFYKFENID